MTRLICIAGMVWASISVADDALLHERDHAVLVSEFQAALDRLRDTHGFPGATAAVALSDGSIISAATGLSDRERGTPMRPEDRMPAGSVGKTFVAAAALTLVTEGKLDLNDAISVWLRDEPWFSRLRGGAAMTVRHLLNHSSGVHNHLEKAAFVIAARQRVAAGRAGEPFSPRELVSYVLQKDPLFEAGRGFHYSDTGYILLGLIIEEASGRAYFELLDERFLGPLRLSLTTPARSREVPGLVQGYPAPDNPWGLAGRSLVEPGVLSVHPGTEWTGGGLVTTSPDLVRWGMALYSGHALGEEMTGLMLTDTVETGADGAADYYGLGVFVTDTPIGMCYGHGGHYPGYDSQLAYFPGRDFAVAIQINRDYDNARMEYILALCEPVFRVLAMAEAP